MFIFWSCLFKRTRVPECNTTCVPRQWSQPILTSLIVPLQQLQTPGWGWRAPGRAVGNHLEVWRLFATLWYQSARHLLLSASATHLPRWPNERSAPRPPVLHHQHLNTFNAVGWNHFPLMRTWWIFFGCFLQAISDQNKCTCTFSCPAPPTPLPPNHYPPTHTPSLATATPPGRVKIDSLASSTRQLRAICSHLGCSSSFCFCDCSSNIIGLKVLEMRMAGGEWRGGHQREGDTKMRSGMKRN